MQDARPEFYCDAMLGGLARWLRAAGYDAAFEYGIDDSELLRRAQQTGAVLLSSDAPMFERNVIRGGTVRAVFVVSRYGKVASDHRDGQFCSADLGTHFAHGLCGCVNASLRGSHAQCLVSVALGELNELIDGHR